MFYRRTHLLLAALLVSLQACVISAGPGLGQSRGPRIINGTLATTSATKHQVSLRRRRNDGYFFGTGHVCGGSLIASNVVLSATHCFVDQDIYDGTLLPKEDFIVVMGNLDRFEKNNDTLIFDIRKIVYLVDIFNVTTYEKDIALLFLNDSVPINHKNVEPIALNHKPVPTDIICQVTGWGLTEDGYLSDMLRTVDVPIIAADVCRNETDFDEGNIKDGMLCAGYLDQGERDACGGDSGGPMVCKGQLAGIVSWGIGCAKPKLPGVYTDVGFYMPWIEAETKAENVSLPRSNAISSSLCSVQMVIFLVLLLMWFNKAV